MNVNKLEKAIKTRQSDCDALELVANELTDRISTNCRNSTISEEGTKFSVLESQKAQTSTGLNHVTREVQTLIAKERELNDDILRFDRIFEDKWKLLNEM